MRTVAVTGATGLIGSALVRALLDRGDRVIALVRAPGRGALPAGVEERRWDASMERAPLDGADAVVHLAGSPVAGRRWTAARKREIRDSRVLGTRSVVAGLAGARVLVSASGIDILGDTGDRVVDESAPPATGFLPETAVAWEAEARRAEDAGTRVVLLRTGLVLAREGGGLPLMARASRFGVFGPIAGGRHFVPWIHLEDEVGLALHAIDREAVRGPMIAAAPEPVRQADFARALGEVLHRPALAPAPALALRVMFGEMAEIVIASHRVRPSVALSTGYAFRYPELLSALRDLLARRR